MIKTFLRLILLAASFFLSLTLQAQVLDPNQDLQTDTFPPPDPEELEIRDTVPPALYFPADPKEKTFKTDTTLQDFQQYDPTRYQDYEYGQLGLTGTAHWPIIYRPIERKGFDAGLHQYDLYQIAPDQVKFFELENAYSEFSYSQGGVQEDARVGILLCRNFGRNANFSIEYDRFLQLATSQNKFLNQRARNTAFATGFHFKSRKSPYNAFITFTRNTIEQKDNGGITTDSLFERDDFEGNLTVPVFLEEAETRYALNDWAFTQYFTFFAKKDTTENDLEVVKGLRVEHGINYGTRLYKFYDELNGTPEAGLSTTDSLFYGALLLDPRGVRNNIRWRELNNRLAIGWDAPRPKSSNAVGAPALSAGFTHRLIWIDQEPVEEQRQNLFLEASLNWQLTDFSRLEGSAHYGLLDNQGDFKIEGRFTLQSDKLGTLSAGLIQEAYSPTLMQERLYVSQQLAWNNSFDKTLSTRIFGSLSVPKLGLEAGLRYHFISNYIFFNTLLQPQQATAELNLVQLLIKHSFRLGVLGLDNFVGLQQTDESLLPLPSVFTKHSIFLESRLFKRALLFRFGMDLRLNSPFEPFAYHPLSGQFHLQEGFDADFYPITDLFISLKISSFRLFFKVENTTALFSNERYYQVARKPWLDNYFRLGFVWILRN